MELPVHQLSCRQIGPFSHILIRQFRGSSRGLVGLEGNERDVQPRRPASCRRVQCQVGQGVVRRDGAQIPRRKHGALFLCPHRLRHIRVIQHSPRPHRPKTRDRNHLGVRRILRIQGLEAGGIQSMEGIHSTAGDHVRIHGILIASRVAPDHSDVTCGAAILEQPRD